MMLEKQLVPQVLTGTHKQLQMRSPATNTPQNVTQQHHCNVQTTLKARIYHSDSNWQHSCHSSSAILAQSHLRHKPAPHSLDISQPEDTATRSISNNTPALPSQTSLSPTGPLELCKSALNPHQLALQARCLTKSYTKSSGGKAGLT